MTMPTSDDVLLSRLYEYAKRRKIRLQERLGGGVQGIVFSTHLPSAIKAFKLEQHFLQEVAVYQRLKERNVTSVCGFSVPKPLFHHDGLLIIEMEIVRPPFVLDFASAGVDAPLNEYTAETLAEWEETRREMFEEKWPLVRRVIAEFKSHGIFLSDVKLGNIMFQE